VATIVTGIGTSKVISNLDTYNHTALLASMYTVSCTVSEQPPSGLTITIEKNGSPVAATSAPAATQGVVQLSAALNCAVNDLISVVVVSSSPSDIAINQIKGILVIRPGIV
jgi:hypothetical protein